MYIGLFLSSMNRTLLVIFKKAIKDFEIFDCFKCNSVYILIMLSDEPCYKFLLFFRVQALCTFELM